VAELPVGTIRGKSESLLAPHLGPNGLIASVTRPVARTGLIALAIGAADGLTLPAP